MMFQKLRRSIKDGVFVLQLTQRLNITNGAASNNVRIDS